MPSMAHS